MRRTCQEIVPGFFVGPVQVSKDREMLSNLGITHIVCIQEENMSNYVRPRFEGHIQYLTLKMNDDEDQNLISLFIEAKLFIDKAIAEGGRALVHDNIGLSLAPAIAIMFAMHHYQLNWEDAMHMVQNRRYCISLNQGFIKQLKEYEPIARASYAVARQMQRAASNSRRKRDVEDVGNREEEVKRWTDSDDERGDKEMEIQREDQRELRLPDVDIELTASDPNSSLATSEPDPYAMES